MHAGNHAVGAQNQIATRWRSEDSRIVARAEHRTKHHFDGLKRPAARQRRVDLWIETALLAHHTADDVTEVGGFRRAILHAFHFAAEPVTFKLGQDLVQPGTDKIHLI